MLRMKPSSTHSLDLLQNVSAQHLYDKLILQLEKDFRLANIPIQITPEQKPKELVQTLQNQMASLLQTNMGALSNLMYIADIAEKDLVDLEGLDAQAHATNLTFLLLKRLWKKVWIKDKYSNT